MSDDRFSTAANTDEEIPFAVKNCEDNDQRSWIVGTDDSAANRNEEYHENESLEEKFDESQRSVLVVGGSQHISRCTRYKRTWELTDANERDFVEIKNSGNVQVPYGEHRVQEDGNPGCEESTYSSEPIHHERNVARDRKDDKFIPAEVAEDTGTRSQRCTVEDAKDAEEAEVEYRDNGNNDTNDEATEVATLKAMNKSSESITDESKRIVDEPFDPLMDKRQEDHERACPSLNMDENVIGPTTHGSPELKRKLSTATAVREDAMKLKAATLDRMGKLLKLKSNETLSADFQSDCRQDSIVDDDIYRKERARKEKTNSLGRMLRLLDKNGEPRKLFPHPRAGSLSGILRGKSTGGHENNATDNDNNRGMFSRMLNQWRNRWDNRNASAEPNVSDSEVDENKSVSAKPSSTSKVNLSSQRALLPLGPPLASALEESVVIEYPA